MKSGERKAKRNGIYDTMEHEADSRAAERFRRPAALDGKMSRLALVKIMERGIEGLDESDQPELERMAKKCMIWKKHKETERYDTKSRNKGDE